MDPFPSSYGARFRQFITFFCRLLIITYIFTTTLWSQSSISDDFGAYPSGTAPTPNWQPGTGFWYVANGQLCESSGQYYAGIFRNRFINTSFEVTVRIQIHSPQSAVGLFFNSASPANADFCQMISLEGPRIIFGYFSQGVFQTTKMVTTSSPISHGRWHTLRLRVDLDRQTYTFFLNEDRIAEELPLQYFSGYVGLQNSISTACFDDFVFKPRIMRQKPKGFYWPGAVAIGDRGQLWIASAAARSVDKVTRDGRRVQKLRREYKGESDFTAPTALATFNNGGVVVLDTTEKRLHLFSATGIWQASAGKELVRPVDLTIWNDNYVVVSDLALKKIQLYDKELQAAGVLEWSEPLQAIALAAHDSMLALADLFSSRLLLVAGEPKKWRLKTSFHLPAGEIFGLALDQEQLYVSLHNQVQRLDFNGMNMASLTLDHMHGLVPRKPAIRGDEIFIPDFIHDRLVISDLALSGADIRHQFDARGNLNLSWAGGYTGPTRLKVWQDSLLFATYTGKKSSQSHQFSLANTQASHLYRIQYAPLLLAVPPDTSLSRPIPIMAPAAPGKTQFMEINCAVILFTNVIDSTRVQKDWPVMPKLDQGEIQRIRAQIEDMRLFYWMNSGMRLNLSLDYLLVEELLDSQRIFGPESYYPPHEQMVLKVFADQGIDPRFYQAIFYIACVRSFNEKEKQWQLAGNGGGFTAGLSETGKIGISWWLATPKHHPAGNNWLAVHEFHHQLDDLFALSGYPEYWFNHFAPLLGNVANFGEHFDGNAYILRNWPADKWFDIKFARLQFADDQDMDGIPDDALGLPMDERRLNSRPDRLDSDGDGVSDRDELLFSNWVAEGHGEIYARPAQFPSLNHPDTDGDGLDDLRDPYPLYPWKPEISYRGRLVKYSKIGHSTDTRAPCSILANWSSDSLYFKILAPLDRKIRLLLDANADGWFVGSDNLEFNLTTADPPETRGVVFNANVPGRWPFMDPELKEQLRFNWRRSADKKSHLLAIARSTRLGLSCEGNEKVGLSISVSTVAEQKKPGKNISIYEPNRFFYLTLKK